MGREVRKVHRDWQHPQDGLGTYKPLYELSEPIEEKQRRWDEESALWQAGKHRVQIEDHEFIGAPFSDWDGNRPEADDHMPYWPEGEADHYQMYETVTEGTPISPVMDSPEALARWLTDSGANAMAFRTAAYDQWLRVCNGGFAPTAVSIGGGPIVSGVEGFRES